MEGEPHDLQFRHPPDFLPIFHEHLKGGKSHCHGTRVLTWPGSYVPTAGPQAATPCMARYAGLDSALPAQPGFAGANYGLRPVGHLQLGEDAGDVVAHRLGAHV
jgi:hypothetical protein